MNAGALRGMLAAIARARPTIRRLILANLYALLALELTIGGAFYALWPEFVAWTHDDEEPAIAQTWTATGLAAQQCVTTTGPSNTITLVIPSDGRVVYRDAFSSGTNTMTTACYYTAP